jgi:hypothetical protein
LSSRTAATGSPEMIVVLFQSATVKVEEKTYLRISLIRSR